MITPQAAILCLSLILDHEVRGSSFSTKVKVANIIMERANYSHENVCKVVSIPSHFDGFTLKQKVKSSKEDFAKIKQLAKKVIYKDVKLPLKGYLYFNNSSLGVLWKTSKKPIKEGNLIFY